ncbi:hypothetical protein WMY93_032069 [Mugilogobius chulae]|uniref:Ig-like domain-containing protein n=1 Tax=Mugilogobius chulae TaxID=88201 RepID=A0AAW0MG77_9GOBI
MRLSGPDPDMTVLSPDVSGPVDSGDSVDLQCWVQTQNIQCFEEHKVWWFRSGLDQSGPALVYTQRNSSGQCDRSTEGPAPHKCLYTFSKSMSPSDAGTYHCAVAACGLMLLEMETQSLSQTYGAGETVTLSCPRSFKPIETPTLHWIRVLSGNSPEFLGGTYSFEYKGANNTPRTITKQGDGTFDLIIQQSDLTDTGFYYCVKVQRLKMDLQFGIFLKLKDPDPDMTVQSPDVSGPVDSGDSVDLQCWVQTQNTQCFQEHMVWWFRSGLDQSGPALVYTQRNSSGQCDRSTEGPAPHKCLYTFSKSMSPSDAGTYHCAVAACGLMLFGNGNTVTDKGRERL